MPLVSRNVTIDPFSLSATAAEPLTGVASTPLSFFLLGATGRTGLRRTHPSGRIECSAQATGGAMLS
jgi:hypothetical protein